MRGEKYKNLLLGRSMRLGGSFLLSALLLCLLGQPAAGANLANNLEGQWNFNENTGSTASDTSGKGHHGTIVRTGSGSPAWVSPGRSGGAALQFDGSGALGAAASTVNLGNNAALDAMPTYVLSVWAKFNAGYHGPCGGNSYANLIGRNNGSPNWSYMLYVNGAGKIRVHHRQSNGVGKLYDSASTIPINQWVHIVQVADGNRLRLYINGVEDASSATASAANTYDGTAFSLPTANTYIGQDTRECAPNATIDDATILTPLRAPGGVFGGLEYWLRSDDMLLSAGTIQAWDDVFQWHTDYDIAGPTVPTIGEGFNFHNTARFNSGYLAFTNKQLLAGAQAGEIFSMVQTLRGLGQSGGYPYEFGGGGSATTWQYDHSSNEILTGFGNTVRRAWDPRTAPAGGPTRSVNDPLIYNELSKPGEWTARFNGLTNFTTATNTVNFDTSPSGHTYIGAAHNSRFVDGNLSEVIAFRRDLSPADRDRVQSYMAVKYGMTLGTTSSPLNYKASNDTAIWTGSATYQNNITGIGRDDISMLNQKQSKSENPTGLVTIGHGNTIAVDNASNSNNFTDDRDFLLFGDNNGNLAWSATGAPAGQQKLGRVFRVQNTGSVGSVKVQVPGNSSSLVTKLPSEVTAVYLLVDTDEDFSSGATATLMTLNGTDWEANSVLANGSYFTFSTDIMPPPDMTATTDSGSSNTDNITNDTTPTFTGICADGQTVTLRIDGAVIAPTATCTSGSYTITPSVPIAEGNHTITAGDPVSASLAFTIDTTEPLPSMPDMLAATDSGASNGDDLTNDTTPTFAGTCTDGRTVTLYVDGAAIAPTAICTSGVYVITPSTALAEGIRAITTTQGVDIAGNTSAQTAPLNVTIDITPPPAPVITGPADGAATNDTTPTFSGTGEEGATVTVEDATGAVICTSVVTSGAWSCAPTTPLTGGAHSFKASQTDVAGNTGPESTPNAVTIDTSLPAPPVIKTPANGTITQDTMPFIVGTGIPNATLHLVIDGGTPIDISVDSAGNWSYTPLSPLSEGPHNLVATQTTPAGTTSGVSATNNFTIDITSPAAPVITSPSNGEELNIETPNILGTGEPYAKVEVKDEHGNVLCKATVTSSGTWSCVSAPLAEGTHTLSATQTDQAGNTSDPSTETTVIIKVNTDGAASALEDGAPNNGDGNGDGVKDSEQGNVTSIPNPVTGGYVTLEVISDSCQRVRNLQVIPQSSVASDQGRPYPVGLFDYTFDCYAPGAQAQVALYLNKAYDTSQWEWRKFNSVVKSFSTIANVSYGTANIGGSTITTATFTVKEGASLDEDAKTNGTFVDPSGPAIAPANSENLPNTGQNLRIILIVAALLVVASGVILWVFMKKKKAKKKTPTGK